MVKSGFIADWTSRVLGAGILIEGKNKATTKGGGRFFKLFQARPVVGIFEPFGSRPRCFQNSCNLGQGAVTASFSHK
jgi:hypothetical protein